MATETLAPLAVQKFFDSNGFPLANGQLFTYSAGTSTKIATYTDSTGSSPNSNPIRLNARGECDLWIPPNTGYKLVLAPPNDTDPPSFPIWSRDNIMNAQLLTLYGGVDTGAVNAYVLTFSTPFSTYVDGSVVYWIPAHTNTSASTVNINGIGAVNILNPDTSAMFAGQLLANSFVQMIYSAANSAFILVSSTAFSVSTGSFTPAWSGFSVAPIGTMYWQKLYQQVTLTWIGNQGTSNATSMSIGNVPTQIRVKTASADATALVPCAAIDNSNRVIGSLQFGGTSTFGFAMASPLSLTGFTNTGTKGLPNGWSLTYGIGQ